MSIGLHPWRKSPAVCPVHVPMRLCGNQFPNPRLSILSAVKTSSSRNFVAEVVRAEARLDSKSTKVC